MHTITTDHGQLPARWFICGCCNGDGRSSAYLGVIDRDEWDADEFEDYLAGGYDRPCAACSGSGKVLEVDRERCDPEVLAAIDRDAYDLAMHRRECEAERRMGA